MQTREIIAALGRISQTAHVANNFVKDGKDYYAAPKIESIIDQITKLSERLHDTLPPTSPSNDKPAGQ
jgi:hypothetical protein